MTTKDELLKEKTVKELRQMARDRNLTGYSDMRKAELVDLIGGNYSKDEIEAWPDLELGGSPEGGGIEKIEAEDFGAQEDEAGPKGIEPVESIEDELGEVNEPETESASGSLDERMVALVIILIAIIAAAVWLLIP